jgi:hypothetical protein
MLNIQAVPSAAGLQIPAAVFWTLKYHAGVASIHTDGLFENNEALVDCDVVQDAAEDRLCWKCGVHQNGLAGSRSWSVHGFIVVSLIALPLRSFGFRCSLDRC